jgi:hypothetical protein
MKSKASLHEHLRTSSDLKPEDFNRAIDVANRLGEYGIFAMTNFDDIRYEHFTSLRGYNRNYIGENQNAIYVPDKKVLVIKAQEVPTKQGHLLALGLGHSQHLKSGRTIEDTIKESMDLGALRIADHPFFAKGIGPYLQSHPELIGFFDAIETHNGEAVYGNKKAREFYKEEKPDHPHLGALSSMDGHSFHELGKSWTEIDFPNIENPHMFIPSLREAIRSTKLSTPRKDHTSYLGALQHAFLLGWIKYHS